MTYTSNLQDSVPVAVEPAVLWAYVNNSASETNVVVNIPWKSCRLAYAYFVVTTIIDNTADLEIDLELNAASGTEMMSITVTKNSAVGTQFEASISSHAACKALSRDDADRDAVCIEIDGSTTGTGAGIVYLYFEAESQH